VLENGQMIARTPSGYLLGVRTVQLGGAYVARFNQVRGFYGYCTLHRSSSMSSCRSRC
jgi:hypothetical protein